MKKIIITFILCYLAINSFGQVSIGNPNSPHPDVILDLTNSDSDGLLLPKTNAPPTSPPGNIVFDSSNNMISYADTSGAINYLSRWKADDDTKDVTYSNTGKIIIDYKGSLPFSSFQVNSGSIKVNDGDVNVQDGKIKEYGHDLVPQGAIIMWSGAINDIPPGWSLCDGTTANKLDGNVSFLKPNLMERFIVGAGTTDNANVTNSTQYAIGAGGNGNNFIAHTHNVDPASFTTSASEGTHGHTGTTGGPTGTRSVGNNQTGSGTTVPNTAHTHTVTTADTQGAHSHTINLPNKTSTAASDSENRPPYYALAFIIKL